VSGSRSTKFAAEEASALPPKPRIGASAGRVAAWLGSAAISVSHRKDRAMGSSTTFMGPAADSSLLIAEQENEVSEIPSLFHRPFRKELESFALNLGSLNRLT